MSVNSVITHTYDLEMPLAITPLRHALASGDKLGDRFDITVTQKGRPADMTGAGVTGYFIRTADGSTVVITGSAAGNVASVTLPESCYAVPGRFTLTVKVSLGGVRHAVYVGEGAVLRSSTDTIIDPGHTIPDLDELLAMISQVESAASAASSAAQQANAAASSANSSAQAANTAASGANQAKTNADTAAANATAAANLLNNLTVWGVRPDETGDAKPEVGGRNLISLRDFLFNQSSFTGSSMSIISPAPDNFANEMIELKTGEDISSSNNGFFGVNAIMRLDKGYSQLFSLQPNEFVTVSCKIRVTSGAAELTGINLTRMKVVIPAVMGSIDNRWSTHYAVMQTTDYLTGEYIYPIYFKILEPNTTIQICDIKLERGSVPTDWSPAPEDLVPTTRTVNGKSLANDISLTARDVGAPPGHTGTDGNLVWASFGDFQPKNPPDVGFDIKNIGIKYSHNVNSFSIVATKTDGETDTEIGNYLVPVTRKINEKTLWSDITLTARDVTAITGDTKEDTVNAYMSAYPHGDGVSPTIGNLVYGYNKVKNHYWANISLNAGGTDEQVFYTDKHKPTPAEIGAVTMNEINEKVIYTGSSDTDSWAGFRIPLNENNGINVIHVGSTKEGTPIMQVYYQDGSNKRLNFITSNNVENTVVNILRNHGLIQ